MTDSKYTNVSVILSLGCICSMIVVFFSHGWLSGSTSSPVISLIVHVGLWSISSTATFAPGSGSEAKQINEFIGELSSEACSRRGSGDLCLYFSGLKFLSLATALSIVIIIFIQFHGLLSLHRFVKHSTVAPHLVVDSEEDDQVYYNMNSDDPEYIPEEVESVHSDPSIANSRLMNRYYGAPNNSILVNNSAQGQALIDGQLASHHEMVAQLGPVECPIVITAAPVAAIQRWAEYSTVRRSHTISFVILLLIMVLWLIASHSAAERFAVHQQKILSPYLNGSILPVLDWSVGQTFVLASFGCLSALGGWLTVAMVRKYEIDIPLLDEKDESKAGDFDHAEAKMMHAQNDGYQGKTTTKLEGLNHRILL